MTCIARKFVEPRTDEAAALPGGGAIVSTWADQHIAALGGPGRVKKLSWGGRASSRLNDANPNGSQDPLAPKLFWKGGIAAPAPGATCSPFVGKVTTQSVAERVAASRA